MWPGHTIQTTITLSQDVRFVRISAAIPSNPQGNTPVVTSMMAPRIEGAKPFILSRAQPLRETGAHIFQIDIPAGEYDFILRYPRSLYHGTTPTLLMVHGVEFLSGT